MQAGQDHAELCNASSLGKVMLLLVYAGYFLAMVTDGQVHVLNEGESVVLECSFHADDYSLFSFPVLWRKQQLDEDVQMNIMGNVNEPFSATNRFEVAFASLAPRYKFELSVLGVYRYTPHINDERSKNF